MHPVVESRREQVAALCRIRGVKRLEIFGSAARDDFDEARSDIDFLVEFGEERAHRGIAAYFDLKSDLEDLLGRPVDLVTMGTVRNPYVRATIEQDRQVIYAA